MLRNAIVLALSVFLCEQPLACTLGSVDQNCLYRELMGSSRRLPDARVTSRPEPAGWI